MRSDSQDHAHVPVVCVCVCVRAVNVRQSHPNKPIGTLLKDGVEVHGTDAELDKHPTSDIHSR